MVLVHFSRASQTTKLEMKVEFARANSKTRPDHAAGRTRALIERAAQIQLQILSMRSTDS